MAFALVVRTPWLSAPVVAEREGDAPESVLGGGAPELTGENRGHAAAARALAAARLGPGAGSERDPERARDCLGDGRVDQLL